MFPNVGGVETHLKDLISYLVKTNREVFVLSYQPLSTKVDWKMIEQCKKLFIFRIPWIRGFFEKLVKNPILEFIYLVPGLFFFTPFVLLFFRPNVIHAHGLSSAVSGVFWGKLFNIRTVISLHSIYTFPKNGLYHDFVKLLLKKADFILSLSRKSSQEVKLLGIDDKKTAVFTYWVDLQNFNLKDSKLKIKRQLGLDKKFVVLFVGRLIKEKGVDVLIESAKSWNKNITLLIIGSGLLENEIQEAVDQNDQIQFLGKIDQQHLPLYYSTSDCLIVPSISEEGFGRVIIEALACGTPVVASKRGAISEAMDETVGKFIDISKENIKNAVYYFYKNPKGLKKLSQKARQYAERRYSEKNAESIVQAYKG